MKRILAINGSYRDDGIIDQAVEAATQGAREAGAEVEIVLLRDYPIEFCLNCRECTQSPGTAPGTCVQHDGMAELVAKIEAADGFILAAPTNFFSVTALFKRFMERLIVYAYWPREAKGPKLRKAGLPAKPALLISSSAAPALVARLFFTTAKLLKVTAQTIGARPMGTLRIGKIAQSASPHLPAREHDRAVALGRQLGSG